MSEFTPSPVPNEPDWSEDPNSPFTPDSGVISGTLADPTEEVLFVIATTYDVGSNTADLSMGVNGDHGGNSLDYDTEQADGTRIAGGSEWRLSEGANTNKVFAGVVEVHIAQTSGFDRCVMIADVVDQEAGAVEAVRGTESDVGSATVDSFKMEFSAGTGFTGGQVEVFTR